MALKTIIIDDELDSLELLQYKIAEYCPGLEVIGTTQSPEEGKNMITNLMPDVVFLDVEMPRINGFRLLNELSPIMFEVIFTTAYSHYAIDAVRVSAFDYLTKPIAIQDLENCVDRLLTKFAQHNEKKVNTSNTRSMEESIIVIPTAETIEFVKVSDIIFLEASSNYTTIYLKQNKKLLVAKSLGEYEQMLQHHHFMRTHNSILVNLTQVVKLVRDEGGSILMSNGVSVPISRRKRDEFILIMKRLSIN